MERESIIYPDRNSPKRVMQAGESLMIEKLPTGTRVIFPKPPIPGLKNPGAAMVGRVAEALK